MKIAVLSSHTPSLFWFRIEMMREFINKGHTVIALGSEPEIDWKDRFKEYHIGYRQLHIERNGLDPFKDFTTFVQLYKFMKKEMPDKVFAYQAKTVIYGSIAAKLNGISEVYPLIGGLGSIYRGTGLKNKILKIIMLLEYKIACRCSKKVFFQNKDDKNEFTSKGLVKEENAVIINGSGVNLQKFKPLPLPTKPAFLFIGRLIKDKGVMEYLEACKIIKAIYPHVRCLLVGPYDSNPTALKPWELQPYIDDGVVEYYGEQIDVRPFIAQCSTYVLPSYHEGTPKTVLEAMAMGRSVITSNAPGCRDAVTNELNGYLVDVKDIEGLANCMQHMIQSPERSQELGKNSVRIATEKYDVKIINQAIMNTMGLVEREEN